MRFLLNPLFTIQKDGDIEGLVAPDLKFTPDLKFPPDEWLYLTSHIGAFETAIAQRFKNDLVKGVFIFECQPFSFSNLAVHTIPHRNSKASEDTLAVLNEISQMLADKIMMVVPKSFDGDSPYHGLHRRVTDFAEANLADLEYEDPPEGNSLVSCDPSHLEKRARYRVLKGEACAAYRKTEQIIDISELPEILNLPSVVFSDLLVTKMNDHLPHQLFHLNNVNLMLGYGLITPLLCFLPLCLMDAALFESGISRSDRIILLQSALHRFILGFRTSTDKIRQISCLKTDQRKPRIFACSLRFFSLKLSQQCILTS